MCSVIATQSVYPDKHVQLLLLTGVITMSDVKQTEIKQEVLDLADQLRKSATIDETKHQVVFGEEVFEETLPGGMTTKEIRAVEYHKQHFALAQTLVTGELAAEYLAKNADVKEVTSSIALPVGKTTTVISRQVDVRHPGTGEITTKYGFSSTRITTKVPGSQNLAVRNRIAELAAKAGLGK